MLLFKHLLCNACPDIDWEDYTFFTYRFPIGFVLVQVKNRDSGYPVSAADWIPAFSGMTELPDPRERI